MKTRDVTRRDDQDGGRQQVGGDRIFKQGEHFRGWSRKSSSGLEWLLVTKLLEESPSAEICKEGSEVGKRFSFLFTFEPRGLETLKFTSRSLEKIS